MSTHGSTCPVPNCPVDDHDEEDTGHLNPSCICNKPLWISIPNGQHIHCPVHPKMIIRGNNITF